jgi:hypothetical protein
MIETTDTANTVHNPQQAVKEFVGEQFIEWLMDYIAKQFQGWPVISKIQTIQARPEKIKKFMLQRFLAAQALLGERDKDPGFLRFAIANLSESDDPTAEGALEILEKRRQDELINHTIERGVINTISRQLWMRLLQALGATSEEIERTEPKEVTRNYIAELSDVYSTSEWVMAVGAFAAQERAELEEYRALSHMIRSNTSLTQKDMEVLTRSHGADSHYVINTSHILDKVVFDSKAKELVWEGVKKQLEIRQEFLEGLAKYLHA